MANESNHSWTYATHNFPVATGDEVLGQFRRLAGIESLTASTEVGPTGRRRP